MGEKDPRRLPVGRISGVFGVKGWVKVYSFTDPREKIVSYSPWFLKQGGVWRTVKVEDGKRHGEGVIVKLVGCDDRDQAALLRDAEIAIDRSNLETLGPDEYYWADLIGLRVETVDGIDLGEVDHLIETGANDVLVLRGERERLIPYLRGDVIKEIDLDAGLMRVDWDPEF